MKILISLFFLVSFVSYVHAGCAVTDAEAAVKKACDAYKAKGEAAFEEMAAFRFCGDNNNYVWFQEIDLSEKKVQLVYHPTAPGLVGKDMAKHEKQEIKTLFINLGKALNKSTTAKGEKVEYLWAKQGAKESTKKISVMMKCNDKVGAGAGFWP